MNKPTRDAVKRPILIHGPEHAHTASMRLLNAAQLLAADPSMLGELASPELHEAVIRGMLETAAAIKGAA